MTKHSAARNRPNAVILMMDTQGSRNVSCYGCRKPTTPNIDQIARAGIPDRRAVQQRLGVRRRQPIVRGNRIRTHPLRFGAM